VRSKPAGSCKAKVLELEPELGVWSLMLYHGGNHAGRGCARGTNVRSLALLLTAGWVLGLED